jgi:hypothetical protein
MAKFRYILFDNIKRQLEFSYVESFHPKDFSKWAHYPFTLENIGYPYGRRLIVDIPIAGETCHIEFDTGGRDMAIGPVMWEKLHKKINTTKPTQAQFMSYKYGLLSCRKVVAKKLSIGNINVKNAKIEILPHDSPYLLKEELGQLGIWYFKNTKIVLDFERKLMWTKNDKD